MVNTIVALATAPLKSALAIIRFRERMHSTFSKIFSEDVSQIKEKKDCLWPYP